MREVKVVAGIGEMNSNSNTQWYIQNRIYDSNGISPCLTTFIADYWVVEYMECMHHYMNGDIRWCSLFDAECTEYCEEFEEFDESI